MKGSRLAIFLSVFFILYGLINYYIYINGWHAIQPAGPSWLLTAYPVVFWLLVIAYPFGRILGKYLPQWLADGLAFVGGLWFAAMLYAFLAVVLLDVLGLAGGWLGITTGFSGRISLMIFTGVLLLVFLIIVIGLINTSRIKVQRIELEIDKSYPGGELHLVMASDLHLGHVLGKRFVGRLVKHINRLNPDLVLFPGDLVDEDLKPVIEKQLGRQFQKLKPHLGIHAVTGNHEYIGGADKAVEYLQQYGIRFLRDEVVKVDEQFYLCGREDVSLNNFTGQRRKSLRELIRDSDLSLPLIVMDHQPVALAEAAENRADLLLCGHTHHGQMWPLNYITSNVFKLSRGHKKIGNTHIFVSSGAGTWGPRIRIGSRPEIISILLRFTQNQHQVPQTSA